MVTVHMAHGRQPWTSRRRRFTRERRSSRLRTAERVCPRQEVRLICPALRQLVLTTLRREADTSLNSQTCSLRATPACCKFASLALRITSTAPRAAIANLDIASVSCTSGLAQSSDGHATTFDLWCFRQVRNFSLVCTLDSIPRIISDEESPFAEEFMGPRAELQMEPGRSSREPPLDYQRWTKIGLSPRLPEPVAGFPGPWATPFCSFLAKTGGSRWAYFFCRDYFSSTTAATDGLCGSQHMHYFWYYFVRRKDWASFSTGSIRPYLTSSPSFSPHQRATV